MSRALEGLHRSVIDRFPLAEPHDAPRLFRHELHLDPIFEHDSLADLTERYVGHASDYYVAVGARTAGTHFASVHEPQIHPREALAQLESTTLRILLKRPERHSTAFRQLLDRMQGMIQSRLADRSAIIRLESAIFITSAASITPFHFDPEMALFSQIEGEKKYHVYPSSVLSERELETFYARGMVEIGQVALEGRNSGLETTFQLAPGIGFYQPQNSPHWVETTQARSVSYSVVFETSASRRVGYTRGFNHLLRSSGIEPGRVGRNPVVDVTKAAIMNPCLRVRNRYKRLVSNLWPA